MAFGAESQLALKESTYSLVRLSGSHKSAVFKLFITYQAIPQKGTRRHVNGANPFKVNSLINPHLQIRHAITGA
jgi:hypothetical protein